MKDQLLLYLILLLSFTSFVSTLEVDTLTCPFLTCVENLGDDICYMNS